MSQDHVDSSGYKEFAVRAGRMTEEERDYLIKNGLVFENSQGELYGEPSTLSFHLSGEERNHGEHDEELASVPLKDLVEAADAANRKALVPLGETEEEVAKEEPIIHYGTFETGGNHPELSGVAGHGKFLAEKKHGQLTATVGKIPGKSATIKEGTLTAKKCITAANLSHYLKSISTGFVTPPSTFKAKVQKPPTAVKASPQRTKLSSSSSLTKVNSLLPTPVLKPGNKPAEFSTLTGHTKKIRNLERSNGIASEKRARQDEKAERAEWSPFFSKYEGIKAAAPSKMTTPVSRRQKAPHSISNDELPAAKKAKPENESPALIDLNSPVTGDSPALINLDSPVLETMESCTSALMESSLAHTLQVEPVDGDQSSYYTAESEQETICIGCAEKLAHPLQ